MPTRIPRKQPTIGQGIRLAALLALFQWYGFRRRIASRRMNRIGPAGHARWERAARRWLDCSNRIADLLGEPEPPEVLKLREAFEDPPGDRSEA